LDAGQLSVRTALVAGVQKPAQQEISALGNLRERMEKRVSPAIIGGGSAICSGISPVAAEDEFVAASLARFH
jgi:hypothetical protein